MHRNQALPADLSVDLASTDATVLVVDDDEDLADTYALWLDELVDVHVAYSGPTALDVLDAEAVDVVLLDRRMPSLSGDAVLAELRDRGHDPRVSMVTAVEPSLDVVGLPFDDYLIKPVGREALLSTVAELLGLAEHDDVFRTYFALEATLATLEAGPEYRDEAAPTDLDALRERVVDAREAALDELEDAPTDGQCADAATDTG